MDCAATAHSTIRLFETARVGLGVFTTSDLDVGDIVAEYTGDLSEFDAIFEGQPDAALKENSGYTLLLNTKSTRKKYVDVDAAKRGSIARYISHPCNPNAVFVEVQYRKTVKVLVRMLEEVKGRAQITVNYGMTGGSNAPVTNVDVRKEASHEECGCTLYKTADDA
ncbi:hypothetical protein PHMEG_00024751 [Phytophthora megakarya]|uniref:SET domain-containing protein n=1 Tax=Phytophthora megakarya TaxID=4795 RepID=A0A225VG89_9STRA|nr:hypothetical protein PHMEG_00024751 [Phytophthora megakarya]